DESDKINNIVLIAIERKFGNIVTTLYDRLKEHLLNKSYLFEELCKHNENGIYDKIIEQYINADFLETAKIAGKTYLPPTLFKILCVAKNEKYAIMLLNKHGLENCEAINA